MTEFKFACPVCGQHMAADSSTSGAQAECPTCFQKVIVPEAPHADSKYILSATQYIKPAVHQSAPAVPVKRKKLFPIAAIIFVLAVVAALAAFLLWRERASRTSTSNGISSRSGTIHIKRNWNLDLSGAVFPGDIAAGQLRGADFVCDRSVLQGHTLTLRQDLIGKPDSAVSVAIALRTSGELTGRLISVKTNDAGFARITLRWRNSHQTTETFTSGYALNIRFGEATATHIPGNIYLCLPDESHSCVAGTFNAEIRTSTAPRPRDL